MRLAYEAAVAGGIPIIKAQRDGLAANRVLRLHGILNGTCNYILTVMRETGRDFHDVLEEAQRLGYAEADPAFDVDGVDAAHKLAILASLAFGRAVDFDNVHVEGIRHISPIDLAYAEELGYRIKLLGIADDGADGVTQRVHPSMVAKTSPIAQVDGVFNAVAVEGDAVGATLFQGRGPGPDQPPRRWSPTWWISPPAEARRSSACRRRLWWPPNRRRWIATAAPTTCA